MQPRRKVENFFRDSDRSVGVVDSLAVLFFFVNRCIFGTRRGGMSMTQSRMVRRLVSSRDEAIRASDIQKAFLLGWPIYKQEAVHADL